MNFSAQATIHRLPTGSVPRNSLYNAIKDAVASEDLTLVLLIPTTASISLAKKFA